MEYKRYPLVMNHPSYKPPRKVRDATFAQPPSGNRPYIAAQPEEWEPEKYGPVTVFTEDQEAQYAAKGYKAAGNADPKAFETAHAAPYVPGPGAQEYPKMVNGVLVLDPNIPKSGPAEYPKWLTPPDGEPFIVKSKEDEDRYLAEWTKPPEKKPHEKSAKA